MPNDYDAAELRARILITERQAAYLLGMSIHTLRARRTRQSRGEVIDAAPRHVRLQSGEVRYRPRDLDAWVERQAQQGNDSAGR